MRVLISGGCGFLGHHLTEHIIRNTDWDIVIIDKLTYASAGFKRLDNANISKNPRLKVFTWDLCNKLTIGMVTELGHIDYILHLAADTHVDNSILTPVDVVHNNIMSTLNLLEYARSLPLLKTFLYFSTDEVYGVAIGKSFSEESQHNPTNPYSASKSGSEMICLSYANTYGVPVIITNTVNIFGERQCVEKYIPKVMKAVRDGTLVEIHCDESLNPGSRFYIHARNVSSAVLFVLKNGSIGQKYNISNGSVELNNLEIAQYIANEMGLTLNYSLVKFHAERPGHDLRYDLNGDKLVKLGWYPSVDFDTSLKKTISWTLKNQDWLEI